VDSILVMRKFSEMEQYLQQIRAFAAMSLDEYNDDFLLFRDAILRHLDRADDEVCL
jgi:hypothetical protein